MLHQLPNPLLEALGVVVGFKLASSLRLPQPATTATERRKAGYAAAAQFIGLAIQASISD